MDRKQVYRGAIAYETDLLLSQQYGYEALSLALLDLIGSNTAITGLSCTPTSPASMAVNVGPGRIYTKSVMDNSALGRWNNTGGLDPDTNSDHQIMKQGLLRDTTQLTGITAPSTPGFSQVYLVEAAFQEVDDAPITIQFYNSVLNSAPISNNLSPARRNRCVLALKAGTAATTGSQVAPTPDVGWLPVWQITVANGQTTITSGNIAAAAGAPFLQALGSVPLKAAISDILAGSDDTKFVTSFGLKGAMAAQVLTDAATIAWNLSAGFRAKVTLGGNRTLGVPINLQEGATGSLQVFQPASGGPFTLAYAPCWDFGSAGVPILSTGANKRDIIRFEVVDAATPVISASFSKAA